MKITSPYFLALLAIVLYSASMLVYGTLCIFKNATASDISAFGSILGGVGAFFGGFVALFIFYGWKNQFNKNIEKELALGVIKDFVDTDSSLSKVKEKFNIFKNKCENVSEIDDHEFNNLTEELQAVASELRIAMFYLGVYFESLRKYSVVTEKAYYNDYKDQVTEIMLKALNLQNTRLQLPTSVEIFENSLNEIIHLFVDLEDRNINTLLKELKAIE